MKCICCLTESDDKKNYCVITAPDKKIYQEFTRLDLKVESKSLKFCKLCKETLKSSNKFLQKCLKSYEKLTNDIEKCEKQPITTKRNRKIVKEVGLDDPPDCNEQGSVDEDDLPISQIQQKIQNDKYNSENFENKKENSGLQIIVQTEDFQETENTENIQETHADQEIHQNPETHDDTQESQTEDTQEALDEYFEDVRTSDPDPDPSLKKEKSKFICPDCGVSFQTSQRLKIHSFTHSGLKNFICDFDGCSKSFATSFRLKAHTRTHTGERPFKCTECPLSFAQGNALKCHKRIHTKERPFVCSICSKSFAQNTTLKTHMAALHLGKLIQCDEPGCEKKFTRKSFLILHKRDHQGLRKYACDRCPNHYKQKSHLDRHIEATHLGIRHKCDFPGCNSEFSKSWSLKMHKFTHQPENSLPYNCSICGATFQRRDKWLKHINKLHPEDVDNLKKQIFEIDSKVQNQSSNFVVLTSAPEIYTIQNADGSFTHVQTLQIVNEN